MAIINFEHATPIELTLENSAGGGLAPNVMEAKIAQYIVTWRQQLRSSFIQRRNIWDDCWKLYRGEDDFSMKQDWQSKIVLPKTFTSVKMATNTIKRLLSAAKKPWDIESVNPDDLVTTLRAEQMTDLTKHFMGKAHFLHEFSTGLESAFIGGLGVWKLWWGQVPRKQVRVETRMVPLNPAHLLSHITGQQTTPGTPPGGADAPGGPALLGTEPNPRVAPPTFGQGRFQYKTQDASLYPNQLPQEGLNPMGMQGIPGSDSAPPSYLMVPQKQMIQEEILEGRLFLRAVDPYNFYWLPGSKLNRWVGTIEDVEVPKWELIRMAEAGVFPMEKVKQLQPKRIDERYKMSNMRFSETVNTNNGPNSDTATITITEYYGPLVWDGKIIEEHAHVVLANDTTILLMQKNPFMHKKSPYIAFSPLNLPFRTEGVGLVEMVRFIDKALSQLANLSVDTLVFRLLPIFEVAPETLENPEDLETGMTPGKILRKNLAHVGTEAIRPVQFNDVSSGAVQTWAALERSHQEGAMISDIAEGLPRWRGQQTATESQLTSQQSESFMGGLAADIEKDAIEPMVTMAMDLLFQFIDTANDPRVASILGVGADTLKGMTREEITEMISGDYLVRVSGVTGQIMKSEMLQNLVQFMNLIGQNPQAWLPYVNEDALLRRILESFRPHIHDIEDIIADPATADAKKVAAASQEMLPQLLQAIQAGQSPPAQSPPLDPNNILDHTMSLQQMQHDKELNQQQAAMTAAQQQHEMAMQQGDQQGQMAQQVLQHHIQQKQQASQPPQGGGQ